MDGRRLRWLGTGGDHRSTHCIRSTRRFLTRLLGRKKFGATWKGAVGALLGALVGFFLPPPLFWLIAGPILGAIVGELLAGRTWKAGSKAGFGTLLGGILAFALKFGLSVCIVVLFYLSLILNATTS